MEGQGSNPMRSSKLNLGSPILRYLHSRSPVPKMSPVRSPLRSIENFQTSPRSVTLFKDEEDTMVIDLCLMPVGSVPGGNARYSSGSTSAGSNSWHSLRLKVPHLKEDLRPPRRFNKKRSDEKATAKLCTMTSPGSCSHGAKCSFLHHLASDSDSPAYVTATERAKVPRVSPMKLENSSESYSDSDGYTLTNSHGAKCSFLPHPASDSDSPAYVRATERPNVPEVSPLKLEIPSKSYSNSDGYPLTNSDWCPLDDGIDISFPKAASTDKSPTREAVNAHIDGVLYGTFRRKRLPVFTDFCPE